ncbi:hypothetical protein AB0230_05095 [Microbacterium sp. NPDC089190]|uniref:hypothetical protein n=1 Tax=Microbacterium sp. NPDC089190 TaxID=3155063 RepID=UPI00344FE782
MTDAPDPVLRALIRATRPDLTDEEIDQMMRGDSDGFENPQARATFETALQHGAGVALNDDRALRAIALGRS